MSTHTHAVQDLLKAGLHFGHRTAKWNPKMKPYLFGEKNGIHVINLEKTAEKLATACAFLEESAKEGKIIMLVSTKQQTKDIVPAIAEKLHLPYIVEKWYGGFLTNWVTTKSRIKRLTDLKMERDADGFARYVKRERNQKFKEIERLEMWFEGVEGLSRMPDVIFVLDTVRDELAVREAQLKGIPVVGMLDSNSNPDMVTHGIPGNDDAVGAIDYILTAIGDAIERGQKAQKPAA